MSNPPYSQRWEPGGKENDPRYSRYGLAPKAKADYAFLLHDLYHLMPDGIMTIVLPHGVLFRGGEEGKNNKLRASDIRRIADTVRYRRNTPRYSRTVSLGEIRQNHYNLNIPRYVDSSEAGEKEDVLSVSGDYGIVNQIEFQGRSFAGASVSNYGVVHTGDIVYTKSPLSSNPYGIIKTNKGKTGIVSTLYDVYHPQENTCADFVQSYFEQHGRINNYMHPLVNKGAKNDMKVSAENALKGFVSFPKLEEQKAGLGGILKMGKLILFHGTPDEIVVPEYGKGQEKRDYGKGFYLTENIELAKEWAVCRPDEINGWVHKYELDTEGLEIMDFQQKGVLTWLAELMKHRAADDSRRYRMLAGKFIEKYGTDTDKYDVIRGWRANASYFYIAKEFVRDNIDMEILEELLSLGSLGIQYCIKTELAYSRLHEVEDGIIPVPYSEFNEKYNLRDAAARKKMRDLVDSDANKVTKVFSTLFEER